MAIVIHITQLEWDIDREVLVLEHDRTPPWTGAFEQRGAEALRIALEWAGLCPMRVEATHQLLGLKMTFIVSVPLMQQWRLAAQDYALRLQARREHQATIISDHLQAKVTQP